MYIIDKPCGTGDQTDVQILFVRLPPQANRNIYYVERIINIVPSISRWRFFIGV